MEEQKPNIAQSLGAIAGSMMMYSIGMMGVRHVAGVVGQSIMKGAILGARKSVPNITKGKALGTFANSALKNLSKMPINDNAVDSKAFMKALGVSPKMTTNPKIDKVAGFIKEQAYSMPVSYLAEYHRAKSEGEDISVGKILRDGAVNDLLFRGAGKVYRRVSPNLGTNIGNSIENIYQKAKMPSRLTNITRISSYYDDVLTKESNKRIQSNTLHKGFGDRNSIANKVRAVSNAFNRTANASDVRIRNEFNRKHNERIKGGFGDESVAPTLLDDKGNYIAWSTASAATGTISKALVNSVKFGGVSVAKSMGISHLWHTQDSDNVYSKIKGQFLTSMESSIQNDNRMSANEKIATTLAHHFGKSDVGGFIKTDFGAKMLKANIGNDRVLVGAFKLPSDVTVTSSFKGVHYYDESTKINRIGASKMMATGAKEDASTFYVMDNNKGGSNLQTLYFSHATGHNSKPGVGQTFEDYIPSISGVGENALTTLQYLEKSLGDGFSKDSIDAAVITAPLIQSFSREGRTARLVNRGQMAEVIREKSGLKVPTIDVENLDMADGNIYAKNQMNVITKYYAKKDIQMSDRTKFLLEQSVTHPKNIIETKTGTFYDVDGRTVRTYQTSTLNELNDNIAIETVERQLNKPRRGMVKLLKDETYQTTNAVEELYESASRGSIADFTEKFKAAKGTAVGDRLQSTHKTHKQLFDTAIDPESIEDVNDRSFLYSELLAPKGTIIDGKTELFNLFGTNEPENVHTIGHLVLQNATSVVEPLARTLGVNIKPNLGKDLYTFYEELTMRSMWKVTGAYGVYAGVNAIADVGAFDGTGLENGLLPFAGSVYNDARMASQFALDVTGISAGARVLESAVPGLVDSTFGAGMLSIAPLIAGMHVGSVAIGSLGAVPGMALGVLGSAVLGGLGSGIFGHHEITDSAGDLYSKMTGNVKEEIRKGRYWAMSSGSYEGDNIQYHRGYWSSNNTDPRMSSDYYGSALQHVTDNLGLSDPMDRNYFTRPTIGFGGSVSALVNAEHGDISNFASNASNTGANSMMGVSQNPTEDTIYGMHQELNALSEVYGMRGFVLNDAIIGNLRGDSIMDLQPQLQTGEDMYSLDNFLWDANIGGAAGNTEFIRRIMPKYKRNRNITNPSKNNMPDWLPSDGYFINFQIGDPYTKIPEGHMRLPGLGYLKSNNADLNNMPYDLKYMGLGSTEETLDSILGRDEDVDIETKTKRQMIKDSVKEDYVSGVESYGLYTKDNPVYYAGNNVIAQSDLQVNSTAVKIEVVSGKTYKEIRSGRDKTYHRKADLLATIAQKPSDIIIVNEDNSEQHVVSGMPDEQLLRKEMQKLDQLKPKVYKALSKEKNVSANNLLSIVDRYAILSDVAPYSTETKNYEKIISDMAMGGELSPMDVYKASEAKRMKERVINKYNFNMSGKQSPLSGLFLDKMLSPEQIDPLEAYIGRVSHGTAMKKWEEPGSYFRSDIATTLSGAVNPLRRGVGSGIMYGVMFGGATGAIAGTATAGAATVANALGGININSDYMESRDVLLQESALGFARNQANSNPYVGRNLFGQLTQGGSIDDIIQSIDTTDRSYIKAFAKETDTNRQRQIAQSIHPIYGEVLDQAWGTDYADASKSIQQATEFYNSIDVSSDYLVNKSANIRDLSVITLEKRGIDPRGVGRGYNQQKNNMYLSGAKSDLASLGTPGGGLLQKLRGMANVRNVEMIGSSSDNTIEVIFTS